MTSSAGIDPSHHIHQDYFSEWRSVTSLTTHPAHAKRDNHASVDNSAPTPAQRSNTVIVEELAAVRGSATTSPSYSSGIHRRTLRSWWSSWLRNCRRSLGWIGQHQDWHSWRPVLRSSFVAWISLVLFLIPQARARMGQTAFFILMTPFLSPTHLPFAGTFEQEAWNVGLVAICSSWSSLGIHLAFHARKYRDYAAPTEIIVTGAYLEPAPTTICAIWLFIGAAFLGFVKSKQGPGVATVATVFASLELIQALGVAPLYPFPKYQLAVATLIPTCWHAAINLIASILVIPESQNARYIKAMVAALKPLELAIRVQPEILSVSPFSELFSVAAFKEHLAHAEATLTPLAAASRLLNRDLSYGRFSGHDLQELNVIVKQLFIRCEGLQIFYKLLDPFCVKLPTTPISIGLPSNAGTRPVTPAHDAVIPPHPAAAETNELPPTPAASVLTPTRTPPALTENSPARSPSVTSKRKRHALRLPVPHLRHWFREHGSYMFSSERPVGLFESLAYMDLEAEFEHPLRQKMLETAIQLLHGSASELLQSSADGLQAGIDWLNHVNANRAPRLFRFREPPKEMMPTLLRAYAQLCADLERFQAETRLQVIQPYAYTEENDVNRPPHRFLFQSFVYQFHVIELACTLRQLLKFMIDLDHNRKKKRLWLPKIPVAHYLWSLFNDWEVTDQTEKEDGEEDPDRIPGIDKEADQELFVARPRNPDAKPPTNMAEEVGSFLVRTADHLSGGNCLFAFKAGLITLSLAMIGYFKATAQFAYFNRVVWAVFAGQLCLARFRGDTAFGASARTLATFTGGAVGCVLWYISAGGGPGNAFGLAAVAAVYFPLAFFLWVWGPLSLASSLLYHTTVVLVLGYSWQNGDSQFISRLGYGFRVAWHRAIMITVGLVAAFLFSLLPPATSIRGYQRISHATTTMEIGALYTSIVCHAHNPSAVAAQSGPIVMRLSALRSKLNRIHAMTRNTIYEISIQGAWPKERYHVLYEVQLELVALLSQLLSVVERLDPIWTRAFLRRTRFLDPEFLADVLACLTMISNALRTAKPLPHVTPVLLEQFSREQQRFGLLDARSVDDEDPSLPRVITFDTLQNQQYMYFCVGVASANAIVTRVDRLMIATKSLVGEHLQVYGLELPRLRRFGTYEGGRFSV